MAHHSQQRPLRQGFIPDSALPWPSTIQYQNNALYPCDAATMSNVYRDIKDCESSRTRIDSEDPYSQGYTVLRHLNIFNDTFPDRYAVRSLPRRCYNTRSLNFFSPCVHRSARRSTCERYFAIRIVVKRCSVHGYKRELSTEACSSQS